MASHRAAVPTRRPGLQAKRAPDCQQQEVMGPATRWVEAAPQPPPTRRMTTQPDPSTSDDSIRPPARGERRPSTGTLLTRKFHEGRGRGTLGYIRARCGCTMFAPACLFVERPGACIGPDGSKRCSHHSVAFTGALELGVFRVPQYSEAYLYRRILLWRYHYVRDPSLVKGTTAQGRRAVGARPPPS